jgi:hypothetical protein
MPKSDLLAATFTDLNDNHKYSAGKDDQRRAIQPCGARTCSAQSEITVQEAAQ